MTKGKEIALITGASSGIGAEFARQLAGRCKAMILVARREERLAELAAQLDDTGVEIHCLAVDLAEPLGVTRVVEAIRQKGPVTMLVNNAGFGTPGPFAEQDIASQQAMVAVHINATLALTRAAIPSMKEAGGGSIINVSSMSAFAPTAGVAVYAGSKAFLNLFSESLQQELRGDGIAVQCLCPGYTRTGFYGRDAFADFDLAQIPEQMWMNADEVVRDSLDALGSGQVVFIPGEGNRTAIAELVRQGGNLT